MDSPELLWKELNLGSLLQNPELLKESNGSELKSDPLLRHDKQWRKPSYSVLQNRYNSIPIEPKTINKKSLDRLADPILGKFSSYEKLIGDTLPKQKHGNAKAGGASSFFLTAGDDASAGSAEQDALDIYYNNSNNNNKASVVPVTSTNPAVPAAKRRLFEAKSAAHKQTVNKPDKSTIPGTKKAGRNAVLAGAKQVKGKLANAARTAVDKKRIALVKSSGYGPVQDPATKRRVAKLEKVRGRSSLKDSVLQPALGRGVRATSKDRFMSSQETSASSHGVGVSHSGLGSRTGVNSKSTPQLKGQVGLGPGKKASVQNGQGPSQQHMPTIDEAQDHSLNNTSLQSQRNNNNNNQVDASNTNSNLHSSSNISKKAGLPSLKPRAQAVRSAPSLLAGLERIVQQQAPAASGSYQSRTARASDRRARGIQVLREIQQHTVSSDTQQGTVSAVPSSSSQNKGPSSPKKSTEPIPTRTTDEIMEALKQVESRDLTRGIDAKDDTLLTAQLSQHVRKISSHLAAAQAYSANYKDLSKVDMFSDSGGGPLDLE